MVSKHNYSVINGTDRATIGRWLGIISGFFSGFAVLVVEYSSNVFESFGLPVAIPPTVFALCSAAIFYRGLYSIFDKHIWKCKIVQKFCTLPCLDGEWEVAGKTAPQVGGYEWVGIFKVVQTWSKISITLKTTQSRSWSTAATIYVEPDGKIRLLYNYTNEPRPSEPDLTQHHGFNDVIFDPDMHDGESVYYNGRGRTTYGEMQFRK